MTEGGRNGKASFESAAVLPPPRLTFPPVPCGAMRNFADFSEVSSRRTRH
jgi:hypothetical protein